MTSYQSKNWILFGSRPTPLLERQLRNMAYLRLADISNLKLSQILVISKKGFAEVFVKKNEDTKNCQQILRDYKNRKVDRYLANFINRTRTIKLDGNNAFERGITGYQKITPVIVYTHYLERILTKESQGGVRGKSKIHLERLSRLNGDLRDKLVRIQDFGYYKAACKYLRRKYFSKDIEHYLIEELLANDRISNKKLQRRKKFYVLISKKNAHKVFLEKEALAILKKNRFVKTKLAIQKELKGLVVCRGNVAGKIKIVKDAADFKKDYQGKIIVSPMTIPQFVPYLKKVKAIITDEGGINCHAAITAREFKIPCIVGTKIATKVLKDGDLVEVDADKGIVRIINKK